MYSINRVLRKVLGFPMWVLLPFMEEHLALIMKLAERHANWSAGLVDAAADLVSAATARAWPPVPFLPLGSRLLGGDCCGVVASLLSKAHQQIIADLGGGDKLLAMILALVVVRAAATIFLGSKTRFGISIDGLIGLAWSICWCTAGDKSVAILAAPMRSLAGRQLRCCVRCLPLRTLSVGRLLVGPGRPALETHVDRLLLLIRRSLGGVSVEDCTLLLAVDAVTQLA